MIIRLAFFCWFVFIVVDIRHRRKLMSFHYSLRLIIGLLYVFSWPCLLSLSATYICSSQHCLLQKILSSGLLQNRVISVYMPCSTLEEGLKT